MKHMKHAKNIWLVETSKGVTNEIKGVRLYLLPRKTIFANNENIKNDANTTLTSQIPLFFGFPTFNHLYGFAHDSLQLESCKSQIDDENHGPGYM